MPINIPEKQELAELILEQVQKLDLVPRNSLERNDKKESIDHLLLERIVRVEEELKHQREIIIILQEQMDKRFDDMNKRFEDINNRFEDMNKRFNSMQWLIAFGFTFVSLLISALKLFS